TPRPPVPPPARPPPAARSLRTAARARYLHAERRSLHALLILGVEGELLLQLVVVVDAQGDVLAVVVERDRYPVALVVQFIGDHGRLPAARIAELDPHLADTMTVFRNADRAVEEARRLVRRLVCARAGPVGSG